MFKRIFNEFTGFFYDDLLLNNYDQNKYQINKISIIIISIVQDLHNSVS